MRNYIKILFLLLAFVSGGIMLIAGEPDLPKVRIMGKSFYYYESEKAETMQEVAERFGWDEKVLAKANPDVGYRLQKGTLLYYPIPKVKPAASENSNSVVSSEADVAESADSANTSSDILTTEISDSTSGSSYESDGYAYHTIEPGESLYGIARKFDTTIENLFRLNPGLTANAPKGGDRIRVREEGVEIETRIAKVEEKKIGALTEYKGKRGDSWASVAEKFNVSEELLRQANPSLSKIERGSTVMIPDVEIVTVEREEVAEDPRASDPRGIREIYNEVHSISDVSQPLLEKPEKPTVSVAIVLTDIGRTDDEKRIKKNKEMEFSRGALTAVESMKNANFRTRLTILDGSWPGDSIAGLLNDFQPNLIISTSDTEIPDYLMDYASSTSTMLVDAFGLKGDRYIDNAYLLQNMTPSTYLNSLSADYYVNTYPDYTLLVAGSPEASDQLGNAIIRSFAGKGDNKVMEVSLEEMEELSLPTEDGNYLLYGTPISQTEVKNLLQKVSLLREKYPLAEIRVIGRPNWVPYATVMKESFGDNKVSIPSRFYFDPDDTATKSFIEEYAGLFNLRPMKASPVYCATAYDLLTYLVPNMASNKGDFNSTFTSVPTIQSPLSLERVSNWGGMVNKAVYILNFRLFGDVDRVVLQ